MKLFMTMSGKPNEGVTLITPGSPVVATLEPAGSGPGGGSAVFVWWRPDGTGDAVTWAEVLALVDGRPDATIYADQVGDGVYNITTGPAALHGANFMSPLGSFIVITVADGAVLDELGGVFSTTLAFASTVLPPLTFSTAVESAVVRVYGEGQLSNSGPAPLAVVDGSSAAPVLAFILELGGFLSGGPTALIANVINVGACIVTVLGNQPNIVPLTDGSIGGDAGSFAQIVQDGSLPTPIPTTVLPLPGFSNLAIATDGGAGPTSFRPSGNIPLGCRYYNTDTSTQEFWNGSAWIQFALPDVFLTRIDHSVNAARVDSLYTVAPILRTRTSGGAAGGYNGAGTGNKSIMGCQVNSGSGVPLGSFGSLVYTYIDRQGGIEPAALPPFANLVLDVNGDGSAFKLLVIDPSFGPPALDNCVVTPNLDGTTTVTFTVPANNFLVVNGLETPPLPPGGPGFVPPTFAVTPLPPYGLPAAWQSASYSVAAILAAYPSARIIEGATGDGGMPAATTTLPLLIIAGSSDTNTEQAWQLTNVQFDGILV